MLPVLAQGLYWGNSETRVFHCVYFSMDTSAQHCERYDWRMTMKTHHLHYISYLRRSEVSVPATIINTLLHILCIVPQLVYWRVRDGHLQFKMTMTSCNNDKLRVGQSGTLWPIKCFKAEYIFSTVPSTTYTHIIGCPVQHRCYHCTSFTTPPVRYR